IELGALSDSIQALLQANQPAAAIALVDRLIARTTDPPSREKLAAAREEIVKSVGRNTAIDEYNAGIAAAQQDRADEARAHFVSAQKLAADEDLRTAATQALARLDSNVVDERAAAAFERGVRAWKAGDYRGAKVHFDSTKTMAMDERLRASAVKASADAGAQ